MLKRGRSSRVLQAAYFGWVLPALRAQPLSSELFGPAKGTHPSLAAWIEQGGGASRPGAWLQRFGGAAEARNTAPEFGLPKVPDHFIRNAAHQLRAPWLARLHGARVVMPGFDLIGPDDRLFDDLFLLEPGLPNRAQSLGVVRLPRLENRAGRFALICTGRAWNYYHWLNDCLPRLRWLEEAGVRDCQLLLPEKLQPFHHQTLDALGIPPGRRVTAGRAHWRLEELWVSSLPCEEAQSSAPASRWLRERLLAGLPPADRPLPRRIYISRLLASKRRLLNEVQIMERLERRGIVPVQTETLSVAEQARLFEQADLVVAPHGAGLANILFMRPGARVLELLPILKPKTCYVSLAAAMGVRYACVTDAPDARTPEPFGKQPDLDFTLPVERIDEALDRWEAACPKEAL